MKRRLFSLALVVCMAAILSYGTLAYFAAQGKADNIITSGSISMELHDETTDGVPFPEEGIFGVMPGDIIDKYVYVENIGDNPFYTRVKLDKVIGLVDGEEMSDLEGIVLDINEEDWNYNNKDGCYYYNQALKPGEQTSPLFTTVTFSTELGNEYQNAHIEINVSAQAVQSQNNTDSSLTAAGWPEE